MNKTFRLGDVAQRSIDQARRAGRKPARLLFGPEIWPVFHQFSNTVPHINDDSAMKGKPPIWCGLPCYKMHAPGIAVVTV